MQNVLKYFLGFSLLLTLSACEVEVYAPTEADNRITQEFLQERIDSSNLDLRDLALTRLPEFCEVMTLPMLEDVLYIDLSNNQVSKITEAFRCFPNLKEVNLSYNQIEKIENLDGIALLRELNVHSNLLQEIELIDVPSLKILTLGYNNLETDALENVWKINSLEELELQHNQIDSIAGIESLRELKTIKVEYNQISDISALDALENLNFVSVAENPLDEDVIKNWIEFTQEKRKEEA